MSNPVAERLLHLSRPTAEAGDESFWELQQAATCGALEIERLVDLLRRCISKEFQTFTFAEVQELAEL